MAAPSYNPHLVKWHQPGVRLLQDYCLTRADLVTTVCDGIADLSNVEDKLPRPALVVRNVPPMAAPIVSSNRRTHQGSLSR
jgi:hypothetical protein